MKIGTTYQHVGLDITCIPTAETAKGVKVQMTTSYPGTRKKPRTVTSNIWVVDYDLWTVEK